MVDVRTDILINRPRTEVAEYAANPDNAPKWYVNIHKSQRLTTGPLPGRYHAGERVALPSTDPVPVP